MSSPSTVQHDDRFQSFTCFPKLPLELRRATWHLAKPERIITFNMPPARGSTHNFIFAIHQPPRQLSEVNRESRQETDGAYIHLKQADCPRLLDNDFFFNPKIDTIYLPTRTLRFNRWWEKLMEFQKLHGKPIKKLAFHSSAIMEGARYNDIFFKIFDSSWNGNTLDSLEEVHFVERGMRMTRSEHIFTPGTQIMVDGEEWGGATELREGDPSNQRMLEAKDLRRMLEGLMGVEHFTLCTIKIVFLGRYDLN